DVGDGYAGGQIGANSRFNLIKRRLELFTIFTVEVAGRHPCGQSVFVTPRGIVFIRIIILIGQITELIIIILTTYTNCEEIVHTRHLTDNNLSAIHGGFVIATSTTTITRPRTGVVVTRIAVRYKNDHYLGIFTHI